VKVLYILLIIIFSSTSNVWSANEATQINERIKVLEKKIQNTKELEGEIESLKNRLEKFEKKSSNTETQDVNGQFPSYNRARKPQTFPGAPVTDLGPQDIQNQFPAYNRTPQSQTFERSTATGFSRYFNPAISANGLLLGTYRSEDNANPSAETKTGFKVQEVELQATANVDNYLRANLVTAFEDTSTFEIEEFYVDAVITRDFSVRLGKSYINFGKHNFLHQHQFPFIDAPLVNLKIFGDEALNESGIGINYLLPLPWYSELIFNVLEGDNEVLLNGTSNNQFGYLLHAKNLWELNEDTTVEASGSFLFGKNGAGTENNSSYAAGGSLTLKWIPSQKARYQQVEWQTEYIHSERETGVNAGLAAIPNPDEQRAGIYSYLKYQFAQNWWAQGRFDYYGFEKALGEKDQYRISGLVGFVPSEFSAVRVQYNYLDDKLARDEHQVLLQLNFTMGSHPAHNY
jgi:hypothetical protein